MSSLARIIAAHENELPASVVEAIREQVTKYPHFLSVRKEIITCTASDFDTACVTGSQPARRMAKLAGSYLSHNALCSGLLYHEYSAR